MIEITLSEDKDLHGILDLQKANHKDFLDEISKKEQGFLTVLHSLEEIKNLNDIEKHVIVLLDKQVEAYVLAMTKKSKKLIPILEPMFKIFDEISYQNKKISDFKYLVCGQVCVGEQLRGKGFFEKAYQFYRENYQSKYDFCITEIASENKRSLRAHEKIGFKIIHHHVDQFGISWEIVIWDWQ